jgi:phenylacetate-CoA ligase
MSFMSMFFGKILIPLGYYLKGDLRFKYYKEYKKNLSKSREEIEAFQLDRLKRLVKHAYETVPYYKDLFEKNNLKPEDIKNIEDLSMFIRTKDIMKYPLLSG